MLVLPDAPIYLVPVVDVSWSAGEGDGDGDVNGARGRAPDADAALAETADLCRQLMAVADEHFVLMPHSGIECRTTFYSGDFLELYRRAVADGVEVGIHLHEELGRDDSRFGDADHMRLAFEACERRLGEASISAVAYRGGRHAYAPFMTELLADNGIFIDLSCRPGLNRPGREAVWVDAAPSGYYLAQDPKLGDGSVRSPVFEIPVGSDGIGATVENVLFIDCSELDNLKRILAAILQRARRAGQPQFVHCLYWSGAASRPGGFDRLRRFLDHARSCGVVMVTPSEARRQFDLQAGGEAGGRCIRTDRSAADRRRRTPVVSAR